ncbi:BadF/BadG/BcrA/BcrD ATPase family protein [Pseudoruegeria sp. SK021]|uniref:BadF/BadG/BcrA/BcrD ATPase family protein n=1 Tax=Pseudoruegeria sp. SK021 TaxID=1933035 RepID=UPI000A241AB5|nr:BadF/BadG/BcrA/BcrD ATPase family protein [Pseudoruegeria sp. SK021]OSP55324.1 hypothetical protein BV911_07760 [Pseudoruegeria sp. SK021]
MMMNDPNMVIAVDGGGSGCRAVLWREGCDPVFATGGPANITTDLQAAIASLAGLLDVVTSQAGLPFLSAAVARVHLALAGRGDHSVDTILAERLGLTRLSVSDDQISTVVGALSARDGAVAGIGTGSFLAVQISEKVLFSGGWGPVIGDQASGHWLGRSVLEQSLLAHDGLIAASALTRNIMDLYGGAPLGLVRFASTARQSDIAGLAPMVVEYAQSGDPVARGLMQRGGRYIMDGLTALGWRPGQRLCLCGGLSAEYADYLPEAVQAGLAAPDGTALDGALRLARQG